MFFEYHIIYTYTKANSHRRYTTSKEYKFYFTLYLFKYLEQITYYLSLIFIECEFLFYSLFVTVSEVSFFKLTLSQENKLY